MKQMTILGETIGISDDYINIHELKFLKDNPRVYACTHGEPGFEDLPDEEQQDIIYKKLLDEPSVKNLLPEIKRHGGLMESILIRLDTMEVIEGNSRLAVYLKLHSDPKENDEWSLIPCDIASSLTEKQQAAFLNQIHVKGKTQWSAFEKANYAYVRKEKGWSFSEIAELFGESEATIRIRIKIIQMMNIHEDSDRSHFSYYDVLVRNKDMLNEIENGGLPNLISDIKLLGIDEESNDFTAQDIRKKLPVVLNKPKLLKKYNEGKLDLDQAYQFAKISHVEDKVKQATALLKDISKSDISQLEQSDFNAFKHATNKCSREAVRIKNIIDGIVKNG